MTAPNAPSVRDVIADAITYHPGNRTGTPDARHPVSLTLADSIVAALKASQPDHLLQFGPEGWTMQHSMDCRLEGRLIECPVNEAAVKYFAESEDPPSFGWRLIVDVTDGGELDFIEKVCKVCGCTDTRACPGGCHWAAPSVCSTCADEAAS